MKKPNKKVVAKTQARSKKEVKYSDKNGNKNEGIRNCPNRACLPHRKSTLKYLGGGAELTEVGMSEGAGSGEKVSSVTGM